VHPQVSSLSRGAQHWAQHATVGMRTEQRNHKRQTFSCLNKGDPVQVRKEQAAGMSSDELASSGVGRAFLSEGFSATQVQATQHFRPAL